jgi:hypothetical protein
MSVGNEIGQEFSRLTDEPHFLSQLSASVKELEATQADHLDSLLFGVFLASGQGTQADNPMGGALGWREGGNDALRKCPLGGSQKPLN